MYWWTIEIRYWCYQSSAEFAWTTNWHFLYQWCPPVTKPLDLPSYPLYNQLLVLSGSYPSPTTHFKPPCMFFSHGLRMQIFSEFVKLDGQKFARVMYTYILDEKYTFLVIIFISNRIRRSICPKKCSKMVNFDEKKSSFMKCHTLRNRQSPTK